MTLSDAENSQSGKNKASFHQKSAIKKTNKKKQQHFYRATTVIMKTSYV